MAVTGSRKPGSAEFDRKMAMLGRLKGGTGMTAKILVDTAETDIKRTVANNRAKADRSVRGVRMAKTAFHPKHLRDAASPSEVLRRALADFVEGVASAVKLQDYSRLLVYHDRELLQDALELALQIERQRRAR